MMEIDVLKSSWFFRLESRRIDLPDAFDAPRGGDRFPDRDLALK
jgi:hypothetical protein